MDPQAALEGVVAASPEVAWSIAVLDVASQQTLAASSPLRVLKTASLAKVFLLLEVAARFEAGSLDRRELLDRRAVARVEDSGLWQHLHVDQLPLVDAAILVAAVSDNWATNALLERVGLDAVQARSRALGYLESRLEDCIRDVRGPDVPATVSLGRAADWAEIFARLQRRGLVSSAVDTQVAAWLETSMDHSMVASAFHLDPLVGGATSGRFRFYNKTGTDAGVRADAGLLIGRRSLAYCALANWAPDDDRVEQVMDGMHAIGQLIRSWAS